MDTYNSSAEKASRAVTETFSSSFSSAIRLFDSSMRQDIYNIYGLVRVADEIVDTHQGDDAEKLLAQLEQDIQQTLISGFSPNVIVHSFCLTVRKKGIPALLISPFFEAMRTDLTARVYDDEAYKRYIYGSAEVVGLMCLKIITNDSSEYEKLQTEARALGAAYQKINFLRDIRDDFEIRKRFYFPNTSYNTFDDAAKVQIITDIKHDLESAKIAIEQLPPKARFAIKLSYDYYAALLEKLEKIPTETLKQERTSLNKWLKLRYLLKARAGQYVR